MFRAHAHRVLTLLAAAAMAGALPAAPVVAAPAPMPDLEVIHKGVTSAAPGGSYTFTIVLKNVGTKPTPNSTTITLKSTPTDGKYTNVETGHPEFSCRTGTGSNVRGTNVYSQIECVSNYPLGIGETVAIDVTGVASKAPDEAPFLFTVVNYSSFNTFEELAWENNLAGTDVPIE